MSATLILLGYIEVYIVIKTAAFDYNCTYGCSVLSCPKQRDHH